MSLKSGLRQRYLCFYARPGEGKPGLESMAFDFDHFQGWIIMEKRQKKEKVGILIHSPKSMPAWLECSLVTQMSGQKYVKASNNHREKVQLACLYNTAESSDDCLSFCEKNILGVRLSPQSEFTILYAIHHWKAYCVHN